MYRMELTKESTCFLVFTVLIGGKRNVQRSEKLGATADEVLRSMQEKSL